MKRANYSQDKIYKAALRKAANHQYRVGTGDERGSFSAEDWLRLCEQYDNRCALCGYERPLTPDHIVPLWGGGPNTIDNIQPLCFPCNITKRKTSADYRTYSIDEVLGKRRASRKQPDTGTYLPAPKVLWRDQLDDIEQYLYGEPGSKQGSGAGIPHVHRRPHLPFRRSKVAPALIAEIRRLRSLVLTNESLAHLESVAWWSRNTLPAALETYLTVLVVDSGPQNDITTNK